MNSTGPTLMYQQRINTLSLERTVVARQKNSIAWGRLAAIIAAGLSFYLLKEVQLWLAVFISVLFIALFFRLVILAVNAAQKLNNLDRLITINQEETAIATGHYHQLPDGLQYLPDVHTYAYDLDIFGRASLFQFINRTTSQQGSGILAGWLLHPADAKEIHLRQEAAGELSPAVAWRQQLQAHGMANRITVATQQKIQQSLNNEDAYFSRPYWQWIRYLGPVISFTVLALYIADLINMPLFNLSLIFFFIITSYISKKATPAYHTLNKISPEVATLSSVIKHTEEASFESHWLQQLQQAFVQNGAKASAHVKTLNRILSRLDYRLNPVVFIPLNIFLFWDLQQMLLFEKWKKINRQNIDAWFEAAGRMEAMASIAALTFNHPQWCFPVIAAEQGNFAATELGHPLIAESKRVNSSFATEGTGKIAVITGSNMAGKSTFLRSIGLALVMGQMGAPVCAKKARFACMKVMSTMRVSDNLEESTSTFYAELKKLKDIIDAVNRREPVFLLLDEILRGTNSLDRHTGSKALLKQLIQHGAAGIIATHDLALAGLIQTYPKQIANYHFDVQVAGEELYFDYKLKDGVCQSLNASVLMKKIGIEM